MKLPSHDGSHSLWSATSGPVEAKAPLDGDIACDVVVVGAGFTGLRAAHKIADAGTSVVVLDAGDVGYGASGRNGGQVNPILPFNGPEQVRKKVGTQYFDRLTEASIGSADSLFSFIEKHQIDCQPRQNGWLRVDHCDSARITSRKNAEAWNKFGANMTLLGEDEVKLLSGSDQFKSGVLTPKGGAVQPLYLVKGIARAAKNAGAQIFGGTPALKLTQLADGWKIQTANGYVTAKQVVLATNGYSDGLLSDLKASIIPFVSVQIATPVLPPAIIDSILPGGQTISDTRRVIVYARREPDNRLVIGSHGNLAKDGSLSGFKWLKQEAVRIFPQLHGIEWEYAWGGKLAVTDDRLPHFYEPAPGIVAGLGYNGRGVAMSNVMGTVLADRVLGAAPESLPFPISPLKKIPLREVQMLGKSTAVWWMQWLDKIETASSR